MSAVSGAEAGHRAARAIARFLLIICALILPNGTYRIMVQAPNFMESVVYKVELHDGHVTSSVVNPAGFLQYSCRQRHVVRGAPSICERNAIFPVMIG